MSPPVILKTEALTKCYVNRAFFRSEKVMAVDRLDLEILQGEIFGFLGPNGAGKTTTLNMIVGITDPTQGRIEIFGKNFKSGDIEPLKRIGYVPETTALPGYYSPLELLDFYAQLFGIPRETATERIKDLLETIGLLKESNVPLKNLSMGQRRLVDFIQALINDPDLILLDEPTVYLDPVIIERFRNILLRLKSQGKTILMSSHMLSMIEKLSDRVAIIDRGRLLKVGLKEDFMRQGTMEEEFLRIVKDADNQNI